MTDIRERLRELIDGDHDRLIKDIALAAFDEIGRLRAYELRYNRANYDVEADILFDMLR